MWRHKGLLALALTMATSLAGGVIYWDYEHTKEQQVTVLQFHRCLHTLARNRVDAPLLARMGIPENPPEEMEDLHHALAMCQAWRDELDKIRPLGGWSRTMVMEHLKSREIAPAKAERPRRLLRSSGT